MGRILLAIRSAETYNSTWRRLLDAIGCSATPLFWQYVSDKFFNSLLKEEFTLPELHQAGTVNSSKFTYEEANAVRYTAGYVCRSLKAKLDKRSNHEEFNKELIDAIDCMCSNSDDCDDVATDDNMCSQQWILHVDRGGLCHINDPPMGCS